MRINLGVCVKLAIVCSNCLQIKGSKVETDLYNLGKFLDATYSGSSVAVKFPLQVVTERTNINSTQVKNECCS